MAVLVDTGELQGLNSTVTNLKQQSINIRNVNTSINEFKTGSNGILAGTSWQQAGAKLSLYMEAMAKCQEAADALSQAIATAISSLMALWDPRFGDNIDDQFRDQTVQEIEQTRTQLDALRASLAYGEHSEEAAAELAAAIASLEQNLAELESLLNAIDAFLEEYHRQEEILRELASELDSLSTAIGGIAASDGFNYDKSSLANINFSGFLGTVSALPTTLGSGVTEVQLYNNRYTSDTNSGTTVSYTVVPLNQTPKYTIAHDKSGNISKSYDEDPANMVKRLKPQVFINCGLTDGVRISDGELTQVVNSDRKNTETMYIDKFGMLGTIPNSEIKNDNGNFDKEKVNEKIDELNIEWGSSVFGAIYQVDDAGNEIVRTSGFANHETSHRPRSVMGQFEDGDYFIMAADGDSKGENGMTFEEIVDYCKNVVEPETGKKLRIVVNMDGGGSTVMYVDGESVITVPSGREGDYGSRDRPDGIYVPYPEQGTE